MRGREVLAKAAEFGVDTLKGLAGDEGYGAVRRSAGGDWLNNPPRPVRRMRREKRSEDLYVADLRHLGPPRRSGGSRRRKAEEDDS